jgi:hypothetical protein
MIQSSVALTVLNPLISTGCIAFISLVLTVQDSLPCTTVGSANSLRNCNSVYFLVLFYKVPKVPHAVSCLLSQAVSGVSVTSVPK